MFMMERPYSTERKDSPTLLPSTDGRSGVYGEVLRGAAHNQQGVPAHQALDEQEHPENALEEEKALESLHQRREDYRDFRV